MFVFQEKIEVEIISKLEYVIPHSYRFFHQLLPQSWLKLILFCHNRLRQFTFSFLCLCLFVRSFVLFYSLHSPIISWHFSTSENLDELSSSSSWLLNQKHSKKRRKDRTRLKSPSLSVMSTAARTRPLQSFHKRKLYRLSPTLCWTPQVSFLLGNMDKGFTINVFRVQEIRIVHCYLDNYI